MLKLILTNSIICTANLNTHIKCMFGFTYTISKINFKYVKLIQTDLEVFEFLNVKLIYTSRIDFKICSLCFHS